MKEAFSTLDYIILGGGLTFLTSMLGFAAYVMRYNIYEKFTGKEHPTIKEQRKFERETIKQALE